MLSAAKPAQTLDSESCAASRKCLLNCLRCAACPAGVLRSPGGLDKSVVLAASLSPWAVINDFSSGGATRAALPFLHACVVSLALDSCTHPPDAARLDVQLALDEVNRRLCHVVADKVPGRP